MKQISINLVVAIMCAGIATAQAPDGLPMDASEGECFARILTPDSVEIITERVIDTKGSFEIREIPAQYETVLDKQLIREGTTVYKAVPAVYKTVPETVEIEPGITKTITRQVVVEPARVIEEMIEPKYEMIEVQKLVSPARRERVEIPATYKTVERRVAKGGTIAWQPILCETNTGPDRIAEVQAALNAAGHAITVDGVFGPQTYAAMEAFQLANDLPVGHLTISTAERLGIAPH